MILNKNLIASNVVILFLILPTLIDTGLALFQCIEIDTGEFRVSSDLDITWYSPQHVMWWFILSLPILIVCKHFIPSIQSISKKFSL